MPKKSVSSNQKNKFSSSSIPRQYQSLQSIAQQPFWFKLWIGFLIGVNIAFAVMTFCTLTIAKLRIFWPWSSAMGILFIVLGMIDIWFMYKILQWRRFGFYGTLGISIISWALNIYGGADLVSTTLFAVVSLAITSTFIFPQWSLYK